MASQPDARQGGTSLLKVAAITAVLIGFVLASLRLLPGSPFASDATAQWGGSPAQEQSGGPTEQIQPTPSPSPTLEPLPFAANDLTSLGIDSWYAWSVLDRRTGEIIGSENMAETNTTASMIKSWIVADYLRRTVEAGRTPTETELADATKIIRDSDNALTQEFYNNLGGSVTIERLLSRCELTDSNVSEDGGWSRTELSPRDTARLGECIADGTAAGPEWTDWLLEEMRLVRGTGDFGIRKAFPSAVSETIAIKNGWVDRTREQENHVNCLAIGDTWTMGLMLRYPVAQGYQYGMDNCQKITEALLTEPL
ncbi:hypothetical protein [Salinispora cortesiana]|uniref:hypothetical protein n=1 Tax=Salinispora cortesiana TaxID=1305843 RepID=UPI00040ED4C5|nr:hypothetical protein [Salinispora cortesiana]